MSGTRALVMVPLLSVLLAPTSLGADDRGPFDAIARDYETNVRPLLTQYCLTCHTTDEPQGELDLERFTKLEQVRRAPRVWRKVVEMLDNGEMPPKKKPRPSEVERARIRDWAERYLNVEARESAGDPGAVMLRRLSNVEYNNTIRDLTGVDLQPAREFPVDGAAGEGFTNVGEALVMSPAMLDKYVAAAKGIAARAVLTPDSFRFSERTTRRDWTDDLLTQIRQLYREYADPDGGTRVNLQGLVWDTNTGGRIPLAPYLAATLRYRELPPSKPRSIAEFAAENHLSAIYLQTLWTLFQTQDDSPLVGQIREHWRTARLGDVDRLADEIRRWQGSLTKFNSVAHFKTWMEPVDPLTPSREIRVKLDAKPGSSEIVLRLVARDAGDGAAGDLVEWRQPRLEKPGRAPILLRDLRAGLQALNAKRRSLGDAARYLAAVEDARALPAPLNVDAIAGARQLDPRMLEAWFGYLGVVGKGPLRIDGLFVERMENGGGHAFVKGWGSPGTPSVLANASEQEVHIPGTLKPRAVVVHPAPTKDVAVGWLSPTSGLVKLEPRVIHAHPACGNGVSWSLQLRRDGERRKLAGGDLNVGGVAKISPIESLRVQKGDLVSLIIGPRGENHACDLTEVNLTITEIAGARRTWTLARDVTDAILAGNPHADSLGNPAVWHFYQEPVSQGGGDSFATIPAGSLLDRWRDEPDRTARAKLAVDLGKLMTGEPPARADDPDAVLHRQLTSPSGPLLGKVDFGRLAADSVARPEGDGPETAFGLPRESFGKNPLGPEVDPTSLVTQAPSVLDVRLPADLAAGRDFVVSASLSPRDGSKGSAQAEVIVGSEPVQGRLIPGVPILVGQEGEARARFEKSLAEFRRVFPAALCYAQIVPVDEAVTLVLFHREDEAFARLMLDLPQRRTLDRLWDELRFVSQDALKVKEAYGQFMEYVTQDGDVRLFEPLRKPIAARAEALRNRLIDAEPKQLDALVSFASRAYRRPLSPREEAGLRDLYANLRKQSLDHDGAFRLTLTRVLLAPAFLYRSEHAPEGKESRPISDGELANRLSYFLWSSMPDEPLRRLANEATLRDPEILAGQARRMLKDERVRSLATEFACQWLDIRGFDTHNEKSDRVFPRFAELRGAMYEESVRFFIDLFQNNGSLLQVLDADYTFVNGPLAQHYDIPGVDGPAWRRVEGVKSRHRGGVLGMASLLSKQSGASRTSPVLRGNWLSEMLLGEKLPKPPKNVPQLPESELDTNGLTMRQMTEKHRAVESCAKCHDRIDPFGFALEGFDAIGRRRLADLAGHPIDTQVQLKDGTEFNDISGLRDYLLTKRRDEFVRHFCRKLLGYSLGRSVQLSDEPLLAEMRQALIRDDYRVQTAIMAVIRSPQFRQRRGVESPLDRDETNL